MRLSDFIKRIILCGCIAALTGCMGGSSESGNAHTVNISGSLSSCGTPAEDAAVLLVPDNYIPGKDAAVSLHTATTDHSGMYAFENIPWGRYYLNARIRGKRLLAGPFTFEQAAAAIEPDSLQPTSAITVPVQATDSVNLLYIKGTIEPVTISNGSAVFPDAPVGDISIVAAKREASTSDSQTVHITIIKVIPVTSKPNEELTIPLSLPTLRIITSVASLTRTLTLESGQYTETIQATSADTASLRFKLTTAPPGMTIDSLLGSITWDFSSAAAPAIYQVGVTVTAKDETADSIAWTLSVTVSVNQQPKITLMLPDTAANGDSVLVYIADTTVCTSDLRYQFFYGDSNSSAILSSPSGVHVYNTSGTFDILMHATSVTDTALLWISDTATICIVKVEKSLPTVSDFLKTITLSQSFDFSTPPPDSLQLFAPLWLRLTATVCATGSPQEIAIDWGDETPLPFATDTLLHHAYYTEGTKTIAVAFRCPDDTDATVTWYPIHAVSITPDTLFDTTPPQITLIGADTLVFSVNAPFHEPGYTAIDEVNGDITNNVVVKNSLTTMIEGYIFTAPQTFTLTYSVVDNAGNQSSVVRLVLVQ